MSTTVIFGGGPVSSVEVLAALEGVATGCIIAADSGLVGCRAAGLVPDVVIGDMDSVPTEMLREAAAAGADIEVHPRDKDATDLELALERARDLSAGVDSGHATCDAELLVIASGAGRLDHLISSALLLGSPRYSAMRIDARLGSSQLLPVHAQRGWRGQPGTAMSLLALHGRAEGVSTHGLRWDLDHGVVDPSESLGISNEIALPDVQISVGDSPVLALIPDPSHFPTPRTERT